MPSQTPAERRRDGLRRRLLPLLLLCPVLVSGCEAALQISVELDRDGAGHLAVALSADGELLDKARAAGADPLADLAAAGRDLQGWEVVVEERPAADGGGRQVQLRTRVSGPRELQQRSAELADALSAPEVDLFDGFQVTVDDDTVRLRGGAGLVPTSVVTEAGLLPEDAVRLLEDSGAFRYSVSARLPGAVIATNATSMPSAQPGGSLDPGTSELVWRIRPGQSVALSAVTERPGVVAWPLVGAAACTVLLLFGGLVAVRRRQDASRSARIRAFSART